MIMTKTPDFMKFYMPIAFFIVLIITFVLNISVEAKVGGIVAIAVFTIVLIWTLPNPTGDYK